MKKIITLILLGCICFTTFAGCGDNSETSKNDSSNKKPINELTAKEKEALFFDELKIEIDGVEIVLGQTQLKELETTTFGENLKNEYFDGDYLWTVGNDFLLYSNNKEEGSIGFDVTTKEHNIPTKYSECYISEIEFFPKSNKILYVNGLAITLDTTIAEIEEKFGNDYLSNNTYTVQFENKNAQTVSSVKFFYNSNPFNVNDLNFDVTDAKYSFSDEEPVFTEECFAEFSIDEKTYTLGKTTLGELLENPNIYVNHNEETYEYCFEDKETMVVSNIYDIKLELFVYSRTGGCSCLNIKARNLSDEAINYKDLILTMVEFKGYESGKVADIRIANTIHSETSENEEKNQFIETKMDIDSKLCLIKEDKNDSGTSIKALYVREKDKDKVLKYINEYTLSSPLDVYDIRRFIEEETDLDYSIVIQYDAEVNSVESITMCYNDDHF